VRTQFLSNVLMVGGCGILALAFPPFAWPLAAWIGLTPIALSIAISRSWLSLILASYLGGLLFGLLTLAWTLDIGARCNALILIHYLAFAWPLMAIVARLLLTAGMPLAGALSLAWVVSAVAPAWVTTWLFGPTTHFALDRLAQSQLAYETMSQAADISGMTGLEMVMAFVAGSVAEGILWLTRWQQLESRRTSILLVAPLMLAACWAYGTWRLHQVPDEIGIDVVLFSQKFPALDESGIPRLGEDGLRIEGDMGDLLVWPETASGHELIVFDEAIDELPEGSDDLGLSLVEAQDRAEETARKMRAFGSYANCTVITGTLRYAVCAESLRVYNCAVVVGPESESIVHVDKRHLVMGGECPSTIELVLGWKDEGRADFAVGGQQPGTALRANGEIIGMAIIPICYEITAPDMLRTVACEPDGIIVNPGCELRLKQGYGIQAMMDHARSRAIELRCPVVRAVRGGVSAIIDGNGRVVAGGSDDSMPVIGRATFDSRVSLFALLGDWIGAGSCLIVLGTVVIARHRST